MSQTPRPGCRATQHGTYRAYHDFGCRCPEGREAWRLYCKRRREGRQPPGWVSSLGTSRRLQALTAIGWPVKELGARLGYRKAMVGHLIRRLRPTILATTAAKVAQLYDELSMVPGPCERTRRRAAALGFAPPLAWDDDRIDDPYARPAGSASTVAIDEVAIDRAVRQGHEALTRAERREAVRCCRLLGLSAHETARRLGISPRTVNRLTAGYKPHHQTTSAA